MGLSIAQFLKETLSMRANTLPKFILPLLGLFSIGGANLNASIMATATYTSTALGGGDYQYDLTLNNTGTSTIGTFWFGWIPGAGFLSAAPTDVVDPTGWTDNITNGNAAIQWVTTSDLLMPGDSISGFKFDSDETPTELLGTVPSGMGAGDPVTTAFVYIAAPLADPGFQLTATPATTATPEPSILALCALMIGVALVGRKFILKEQR
jgi:hypothetical protein